jgi:ABC-type sulfate/molybdate transport systems ATPase subunit
MHIYPSEEGIALPCADHALVPSYKSSALLHCRAQIIVTHDQEEAFDLADQVVIFNRGLIEQSGSPNEIIKRPATPFVMGFVGDTNSVPAGCMLVRRSGFHPTQGKARVMFRPSDIKLSKEYSATMDGQQVREAVISSWVLFCCTEAQRVVVGHQMSWFVRAAQQVLL